MLFILMYLMLILCIVFLFERYHIGEVSMLSSSDSSPHYADKFQISKYYSFVRLIFIGFTILMCILIRIKKTLLFVHLSIFNIFLLFQFVFNSEFPWLLAMVNSYTSSCLWIYVYMYSFICTSTCYNLFSVERITIFLAVLCFVLFLRNYIECFSRGIQWSYIESYFMITILPLLPWLKVKTRYVLVAMSILTMLLSAKRTGILMGTTQLLCYFYMSVRRVSDYIKRIPIVISAVLMGAGIVSVYFDEQFYHILQRFQNIEDDGGSGRDIVYSKVLSSIFDSDVLSFTFGHGYNAVLLDRVGLGFSAHNEFLEVFYDYGLIGFLAFVFVFFLILRIWRMQRDSSIGTSALMSFLVFLMLSMTSHSILTTTNILPLALILGYIDACKQNK